MQMTNDEIWAELSKVYNLPNLPEEATEIIGDLMLKLGDDWIPCSEWLPEDGKRVLITGYYNGKLITDVAIHEYGCWDCCDDSSYDDKDVIAWMPLPDPYNP